MTGETYESLVAPYKLQSKEEWLADVAENVAQAHANNYPAVAFVADLDDFKNVNDTFGHSAGDQVIDRYRGLVVAAISVLRQHGSRDRSDMIRVASGDTPIAGVLGGDEIGIFAFTDHQGAAKISHRVRGAVEEDLDRPENLALRRLGIGVSIGYAILEVGMSASELFNAADKAMYENKRARIKPADEQMSMAEATFDDIVKGIFGGDEQRTRELLRRMHYKYVSTQA